MWVNKSIDFSDKQLELIPEAYLDEGIASISETVDEIDKIVRELFSFLITSKQISNPFLKIIKSQKTSPFNLDIKYKIFSLNDLFSYVNTGNFHVSGELDKGNIPLMLLSVDPIKN
jgi:hypothetical protein